MAFGHGFDSRLVHQTAQNQTLARRGVDCFAVQSFAEVPEMRCFRHFSFLEMSGKIISDGLKAFWIALHVCLSDAVLKAEFVHIIDINAC